MVTVLPAVRTPRVVFPLLSCYPCDVCLCCMTSAKLRLQWTETTGIVAKMRARIQSYLYPPNPEKLHAGLSHQVGRAGEMEWIKKKRKEVDTGSSLERKLKAGFLPVCLPGHQRMCLYACTHVILYAQQDLSAVTTDGHIEKSTTANQEKEVWKNCSHRAHVQSHTKTISFIHTNTHQC